MFEKKNIRIWRSNVLLKEECKLKDLKANVDSLDTKAEHDGLLESDVKNRLELLKQIEELEHIKSLDLKQKAKIKWAIEGDENTKFFHGIVNNNFSRSRINGILIKGTWVTDPPIIIDHIFQFHKNKFDNNSLHRLSFTSSLFKKLSSDEISFLDSPFTIEEIKNAVWVLWRK